MASASASLAPFGQEHLAERCALRHGEHLVLDAEILHRIVGLFDQRHVFRRDRHGKCCKRVRLGAVDLEAGGVDIGERGELHRALGKEGRRLAHVLLHLGDGELRRLVIGGAVGREVGDLDRHLAVHLGAVDGIARRHRAGLLLVVALGEDGERVEGGDARRHVRLHGGGEIGAHMREGAHAHDVAVVLPRDGGDLDDAARHLGLRDGAEAVALGGGDRGFAGIALTPEGRAHDEAVVDADRRLQGAADQAEGEDGGQHRAEQPAQADAAPVRRALGDVARVERIVVAEVDHRPKRASSLQRWQAGSPSPKQFCSALGRAILTAS